MEIHDFLITGARAENLYIEWLNFLRNRIKTCFTAVFPYIANLTNGTLLNIKKYEIINRNYTIFKFTKPIWSMDRIQFCWQFL